MGNLNVIDVSRYQGPEPDYTGYDAVIVNITPQNNYRDSQIKKAHDESKVILYYSWPLAFSSSNWITDASACAAYVNGLISEYGDWARGPIFQDYESGSFVGDPVSGGLYWIQEIHNHNLGAHDYVQYSLIRAYNWQSHVDAGAALWFAEYTDNPDQAYGPWPFATGWQYSDKAGASGGDSSVFYCDANAIHALSFPPGGAPVVPASNPAPVQAPAQPAPAPEISGQATVEPGDSLSSIAQQVGVSLEAIESVNHQIPNFDLIEVGQVINLPAGANLDALHHNAPAPAERTYTVQEGDTLSGIAAQYGTDYQTLANINGIPDPNYITVGEVIKLP